MSQGRCCCSAGDASREEAAAKERPFQRVVSVDAAAAEAGDLPGGVQPVDGLAVDPERARGQIGLMPPRLLRVRMCSLTPMSGPTAGSRMRCGAAVRARRSAR